MNQITRKKVKSLIPIRKMDGHKGDFGKVLIFAGSKRYTGAAYLCTQGAVKSGSGLVTLATDKEIVDIMQIKLNEAMILDNDSNEIRSLIEEADSIAIGPGMGNNQDTFKAVSYLIGNSSCPIILDADAVTVLEGNLDILKGKTNIILTPHVGEFSKIIKVSQEIIIKNKIEISRKFAEEFGVTLILKGYNTVVADKESLYINTTGSSKMASGGMGDVLTGIIASFVGQGLSPLEASLTSVYIHGYAGDTLGEDSYNVTATEVLENLGKAIDRVYKSE